MSLDCLDELAIQRLFVFLKENLNFESLQDELSRRNLLSEKETKEYAYNIPGEHFRVEKLLKLIIKKRKCNEFVKCLHETAIHNHIWEKIREFKEDQQSVQEDAVGKDRTFAVTDELLQKHFEMLYTDLEPRVIADELFQADCISVSDHDSVTDSPKKYDRLRSLLEILKRKKLHGPFLCTLESLQCDLVLKTLQTDHEFPKKPSEYAMWIQRNFTLLQEELPDYARSCVYDTDIMKHVFDYSNISDIESCNGTYRQKSKLLKILLMKGQDACEGLISAIKENLERKDLIHKMKRKCSDVMKRGKPVLIPSLTFLTTSCLQEHKSTLFDELEPIVVCDLLFEEGAMNILDHDIITETNQRQQQIKKLIEKVKENKKDCFHFFLYILQEKYKSIPDMIKTPPIVREEAIQILKWRLQHSVVKVQDDVKNEPIQVQLTGSSSNWQQVKHVLDQRIYSSDAEIFWEVLNHGQMDIADISFGSVDRDREPDKHVLYQRTQLSNTWIFWEPLKDRQTATASGSVLIRLRPVTDQAVQNLISAKENNKLLKMFFGILRSVNITKLIDETEPLQIEIKIFYDRLAAPKKKNGDLRDLSHRDVGESIDPCDANVHIKAEEIRKEIASNYENILNEMQVTLAKETLSRCDGNTSVIKEQILPVTGNRRQRMTNFLRFILQDDRHVLEFEKMLTNNGLQKLLISAKSVQGDHITNEDIEVECVEATSSSSSEGSLFESVITLTYTDHLAGLTVRRMFVFLKENLIFSNLQDEFYARKFFPENESEEYVFGKTEEYYRGERFLKLLIKKNRCKKFLECMHDLPSYKHVLDEILKFQKDETNTTLNDKYAERKTKFNVTNKLLQDHFEYLFTELEPREIADGMFQAGYFSPGDHDNVTDLPNRHKRLKSALAILDSKHLHAPFLDLLESLKYISVLKTLLTERQLISETSNDAVCIQHSFSSLLKELPDQATHMMEHVLTQSDISDIEQFKSVFRQKAKLLKIILRNKDNACAEFFKTISLYFKREDLIESMKMKSAYMLKRGKPLLNRSLSYLTISCLRDSRNLLEEELEPIKLADLLFEERAVDILAHDRITENIARRKQIKHLLETVEKNKADCFHYFLFILQNEFQNICIELQSPNLGAFTNNMLNETRFLTYEVAKAIGDVQNEDIAVHVSVSGGSGSQIEHELCQRIRSDDPDTLGEIFSQGQMEVDYVIDGSVVLQLRPVTDDAVKSLLNAKENNRLLEMIFGILKKAQFDKRFYSEKPCQIRVQVYYAKSTAFIPKSGVSRTTRIKNLIRAHRNELLFELEPVAIISALSRSKTFQKRSLSSICASSSCNKRINDILSLVECGNTDAVESFVAVLKDLGYRDIVDLIDPPSFHTKAEDIRKCITSNYKNILDEMQVTLANETLSKCIGDVDPVRNKISQRNTSRRQRMHDFLRFIVKDDHNVIEFARVLKNNCLEDLLRCKHDIHREYIPVQDIEMMVVDDYFPPVRDGVLFDSLITLAYGDKTEHIGPRAENIESGHLRKLFGSFCIKMPEDIDRLSFTKDILGESNLAEFVEEIRHLARNVVLYKSLKDEEKKPGTVYVYEVIVKYTANQLFIDETDAGQRFDFFYRKNQNLVKVILIKGGFHSVLQAKKKTYQKYNQFFNSERFHLHHESEEYTEVAKLSANQKALSYKQFVESVRESISLQNIEKIVKDAVNRALSRENITELCFDAVLQESGNTNSNPYNCRLSSTVNRLKQELMRKTVESVSKYLGSEICNEIEKHIKTEFQRKISIDTDSIYTVLSFSSLMLLETMLTVIATILNPLLGILVAIITALGTFVFAVNVNSRSWRRDVANAIYEQCDKNKEKVLKELSSIIKNRFKITADHLKMMADRLEEFRSSIQLNDQDTRSWKYS